MGARMPQNASPGAAPANPSSVSTSPYYDQNGVYVGTPSSRPAYYNTYQSGANNALAGTSTPGAYLSAGSPLYQGLLAAQAVGAMAQMPSTITSAGITYNVPQASQAGASGTPGTAVTSAPAKPAAKPQATPRGQQPAGTQPQPSNPLYAGLMQGVQA